MHFVLYGDLQWLFINGRLFAHCYWFLVAVEMTPHPVRRIQQRQQPTMTTPLQQLMVIKLMRPLGWIRRE